MLQVAFPGTALVGAQVRELPSLQMFGFRSSPMPGCDVVAVFLSGDRTKGVVIASGDQRYRVTVLASGDAVMEDAFGHTIHMSESGIASTGTWTHNGTFTATGDIVAGTTSLQNHLQSGVAEGTSNSGPPVAGT